jgi:HEAT repeat protein
MFKSVKQREKKKKIGVKKPSMETLIKTLSSLKDKPREGARHALVAMGKPAVPSLIKALKSKNALMRWEAAKALGEIGDPETAPVLVEALEHDDFDVRWLAAEGLVKMNIKGLKPLLQALEHRGDSVWLRESAHHVFHDLAKGGLRKSLVPVLAALEALEPGKGVPWAARHELAVEVPLAARQALEMLEKLKKP